MPLLTSIRDQLTAYLALFPEDWDRLALLREHLDTQGVDILDRTNMTGHVTVSLFVLNKSRKSALVIQHRLLGMTLQPGGHYEDDPSLQAAGLRETSQETGVAAISFPAVHGFPNIPIDVDTHWIPARPDRGERTHPHHDFAFLGFCSGNVRPVPQLAEVTKASWMHLRRIRELPNPRMQRLARKALRVAREPLVF